MESRLGSTSFRKAGTHAGRVGTLSCGQHIPIAPDSLLPSRAPVLLALLSLFLCLGVHSSGVTFLLESPLSGTVEGPLQKPCSVGGTEALCARAGPCQVSAFTFVAWRHAHP